MSSPSDLPDAASPTPNRLLKLPIGYRFALLNLALVVYGFALSVMVKTDVGLIPWDALHVGMAKHISWLTIGTASISVGLLFQIIASVFLKIKPGIGTILNMVLIGLTMDLFIPRLPTPTNVFLVWLMFLGGTLLSGLSVGTYIATNFGAGPRDSVTLGLAERTGWPVRTIRTVIELTALAGGWLLGAKVGWGTLVFAILFGPAMSLGLRIYGIRR